MFVRPRVLLAALASLPLCLTHLFPAPAHAKPLVQGASVRQEMTGNLRANLVAAIPTIYVSTTGNDANDGTTLAKAKKTIQAGITASVSGGTVNIEPGTYQSSFTVGQTIPASRNYDLNSNGRDLILQSDPSNGGTPANTVIDFQGHDINGLVLGAGITPATRVAGLTFKNGAYTDGTGGAISISGCSPTIQNCVFLNNQAAFGGAIIVTNGSPTIRECTFTQNQATSSSVPTGGAIEIQTDNSVTSGTFAPAITNCVFSGNSAQTDGAAIDVSNGLQPVILNVAITNCTFTGDISTYIDATDPGGAVGIYSANVVLTNDILYGDTVLNSGSGGEIQVVPSGSAAAAVITASHDDVQGGFPGTNDINQDPKFTTGLDLAASSPAINVGTTAVPVGVDISIDRTGRSRDAQPDMGAFEVLVPTANAQSSSTAFNTAKAVTLSGTDPNVTARALTYSHGGAANGIILGSGANLTYTPNTNFSGTDSFTFTVNNGTYSSASATVSVTVGAGAPIANPQNVSTNQNTTVSIILTGSDSNIPRRTLTYVVVTNPAHGTLSGTAPNLTYTPNANFSGTDSFTFKANNGTFDSAPATVTLTIVQVLAPTATAQSVTTNENAAVPVTLTGSDPNNPARTLTYTVVTNPAHGTLSGSGANLTYTPAAGYFGADSFTFKANNGTVDSAPATVSLAIAQVATHLGVSAPIAATAGQTITVTVTALDAGNAVVAGDTDTVALSTGDPRAALPPPFALSGGTGTASVTFGTAGAQTLTGTAGALSGTAPVTVSSDAASTPRLAVSGITLVRADSTVTATVTLTNSGAGAASNVSLTAARLGGVPASALPAPIALGAGQSQAVTVTFTGTTAGARVFLLNGAYTAVSSGAAGSFSSGQRVSVP